jgi:DNA-3-methyladenine glycosylase II
MKRLKERPDPKRLREIAEPWRPYRSYASRMLWHYYHATPAV